MKHGRVIFEGRQYAAIPADTGHLYLSDGRRLHEERVTWLAPYAVGTMFALAINYSDHAKEIGSQALTEDPVAFLKGPNALVAHCGKTRKPQGIVNMNYECELAAVIGETARNVSEKDALAYVSGYTVANDYAFRDYLESYYRPNLRVKNRDSATALGPWLVDASDIPDPMNLRIRTYVNGQQVQDGCTCDMTSSVAALIAYFSSFMTLQPGDTIMTGTPKGTINVNPGDVIITEVESVCALKNTIVDHDEFPPVLWPGR